MYGAITSRPAKLDRVRSAVLGWGSGVSLEGITALVSRRLSAMGAELLVTRVVEEPEVEEAIRSAIREADLTILIGPPGRRSSEIVARSIGREVILSRMALDIVKGYLALAEERPPPVARLPEEYEELAYVPAGSLVLRNPARPAPGYVIEDEWGVLAFIPGLDSAPALFEGELGQFVRALTGAYFSVTLVFDLVGSPEEALREAYEAAPWAYFEVKGRKVEATVYAKSPEELSERMEELKAKVSEKVSELSR